MVDLLEPKLRGVRALAGIVKRTLGPGGLPIIIERVGQALDGSPLGPKITKDGVSVAEECWSEDPIENLVIQAVKAICRKTNVDAGDGTTSAIVLGEAILEAAQAQLKLDPTLNPQLVKESIEAAAVEVLAELKKRAIKVTDLRSVEDIATISANGDRSIGSVIRAAFEHAGAEGVITVDEGSGTEVTLEVVDGYRFNKGAQSRSDFFNNKDRTQFEAENAQIILYDGKLFNFTDLIPALHTLLAVNAEGVPTKPMPPLVVIANEFSREVIQFLLMQKAERGFQVCAVVGPHMSNIRTGYYDDLAVYTGATRLGNGGRSLTEIQTDDFGLVGKVVISQYKTTLYQGQGAEADLLERVEQLKGQKALAETPYDAQVFNDRIAALVNGVAKIGVGGATELEIKEKYDRIEDALNAARAALAEGVVAGGGAALLSIAHNLAEETVGQKILKQALKAPFRQILENVGLEKEELPLAQHLLEDPSITFDARNKVLVNALETGIIDPVKVTRTAFENAVSIASLLTTAGGAIIYTKKQID